MRTRLAHKRILLALVPRAKQFFLLEFVASCHGVIIEIARFKERVGENGFSLTRIAAGEQRETGKQRLTEIAEISFVRDVAGLANERVEFIGASFSDHLARIDFRFVGIAWQHNLFIFLNRFNRQRAKLRRHLQECRAEFVRVVGR